MPDPDPSTTNKPTMRAVVFDGHPYKVHVRTLPKLTIVWQTDAVVRLTAVHPRGRRAGDHRGVLRDADVPGRVQRGDTISPTVPCPLSEVWKKGLTLRAGPVDSKTAVAPLLELIRGGEARRGARVRVLFGDGYRACPGSVSSVLEAVGDEGLDSVRGRGEDWAGGRGRGWE
ncbi:uncharacterized protein BO72DRAFT_491357 [Aspergillus fijiensis CBS 313.89]|uniref:Uncharacterized protein n=1 Tax=Aspergillus fijiensis CBS 313.89 TaxID=1448319 RepID=A0A8G1S002_9EURO|nr:uncharacterized protein BO72DRAFT_491357 [Aspergillus fijiensis CBS 313.89]RAK82299.1 hypothetical protein BO72DRAFT_491357 [Aspergillus fijiensis CBS 313.89]